MPLTLPKISRTGTTPSRKRFWDNARETLLGLQKVAGRHVTVDEHKGRGSIINIEDTAGRRGGTFVSATGACCVGSDCSIQTAANCNVLGGTYQGNDTPCDPNPCGEIGPCPCGEMFTPYEADGTCYTTLTVDGSLSGTDCGGSGLSGVVPCDTLFRTFTCTNTACEDGFTGSCTTVARINDDCVFETISCSGDIFFADHCIEGCTAGECDSGCVCDSAVPGTLNVSTLSEPCTL